MSFYEFNQNNSGGRFDFNAKRGISHIVIVEAESAVAANERAEAIGLYWDGCDSGQDCRCCGDRWYQSNGKGTAKPSVYGKEVTLQSTMESLDMWTKWMKDKPEVFVHYADGRVIGMVQS